MVVIADNTVVIFTSDNGAVESSSDNSPYRRGKGHLYEGGIRIPLIIRWPGHINAGSVSANPTISQDIFTTIVDIAYQGNYSYPDTDGRSLVEDFSKNEEVETDLFWYYPHYSPQAKTPGAAIRSGDYKLIQFYDPPKIELYNLKNDNSESHNLAHEMPEKVFELSEKINVWLSESGAILHQKNPNYRANVKTQ